MQFKTNNTYHNEKDYAYQGLSYKVEHILNTDQTTLCQHFIQS